jgi:surface protein
MRNYIMVRYSMFTKMYHSIFNTLLVFTGLSCGIGSGNIDVLFNNGVPSSTGQDADPFISTWRTTSTNEGITLPLKADYNYSFTVNWGDSTPLSLITSAADADKTHYYASPGDYTVKITGILEAWYFNNLGDKDKIISVTDLGDMGWTDLSGAFYGCSNLTYFAGGNTAAVTSMSLMFADNDSLTTLDLSHFDTAAVTNMTGTFANSIALTRLDISNFDTAAVTSMYAMFINSKVLTSLDLSSFDTSAATTMFAMFYGASALTEIIALSNFDTAAVTDMSFMFYGAGSLTSLDLSNFNTAAVTSMLNMFAGASSLTSFDLSSFDTAKVTNMGFMFSGASSLTSLDLSNFDTAAVTNMNYMFENTASLTTLDAMDWQNVTTNPTTGIDIFTATNAGLIVTCDQGGTPATGSLFTKACN